MASTFILTSAPLLLSQVQLASFVPDISQPYADSKRPYRVSQSDYSIQQDTDFAELVSTSSNNLLQILATKFAGLLVQRENNSTFQVEAESGSVYTLDNPDELFTSILESDQHGNEAKQWLEKWKRRGLAPRFVVGYRTFVNARLAHTKRTSQNSDASTTVPLSAIHVNSLPIGMAEIKLGAMYKTNSETQRHATISGERIYAVAYRKIRVMARKGVVAMTVDVKTKWESFSGSRGDSGDEDIYLEAYMSDTDDDEDCEIFVIDSMQGGSRDSVRIGLLGDDSDESEDSEADEYM